MTVHDLNDAPLKSFYEKGLITADGKKHEFDAFALATGFDAYSGSMTQMGLKNKDGVDLADAWYVRLVLFLAHFPYLEGELS